MTSPTRDRPAGRDLPAQPLQPGAPLPLVFDSPKRGKPPRHWADLTVAERRDAVVRAGHRPFRASQLSTQWFERLEADPQRWTDLPGEAREALAATFFPALLTPVRTLDAKPIRMDAELHEQLSALADSIR